MGRTSPAAVGRGKQLHRVIPGSMPRGDDPLRPRGCTMKPTLTSRLSMAGVLLATLGLPAAAPAQYRLPSLVSSVRADSLHEAAVTLARTTHRWGDAARLHRRSARASERRRSARIPVPDRGRGPRVREQRPLGRTVRHGRRRRPGARAGRPAGGGARLPRRRVDRAGAEEPAAGLGARATAPRCWPTPRCSVRADRAAILQRISRAPEAMQTAMRKEP